MVGRGMAGAVWRVGAASTGVGGSGVARQAGFRLVLGLGLGGQIDSGHDRARHGRRG